MRYRTSLSFVFFLTTFVPVDFPTLTMQVLYFSCSLFYTLFICSLFCLIPSRYLTVFVHFYVDFTLFIALLYIVISQRFLFHTSTFFLWHAVTHCLWKEILSQQRIRHFKILQSISFAYDVGITNSYSNKNAVTHFL